MPVKETKNGYTVRREVRKTGLSLEDAERLDALLARANETALRDFGLGLSGCPTILESLEDFVTDPTVFSGVTSKRIDYYRKNLTMFARELSRGAGDISVDAVTLEDLKAWLRLRLAQPGNRGKYVDSKTLDPETAANQIKVLKRFAKWCAESRFCSYDLDILRLNIKKLRNPKRSKKHNRFPPRAVHERDFLSFLKRLRGQSPRVEFVLRAMLVHGVRPEAVFLLAKQDYVPPTPGRDGWLAIPDLKGGVPVKRFILHGSYAHEFMSSVCSFADEVYRKTGKRFSARKPLFPNLFGNRWVTSAFDRSLSAAVERLKIGRRYTAYMARHSAVTWLLQRGVSPVAVKFYAKHLSISTQEIYDWTTSAEAAPAYEMIEHILASDRPPAESPASPTQEVGQLIATLVI